MTSHDPSEHLNLIYRVIGQMGLPPWDVDEAYSEGLVAITEAAQKYDESRGVPLVNWLARNIRWSIASWREKQYPTISMTLLEEHILPDGQRYIPNREWLLNGAAVLSEELFAKQDENNIYYHEVIDTIKHSLAPVEQQVLLGGALGFKGKEIALALDISEVEVSRAKKRAREKLLEILK